MSELRDSLVVASHAKWFSGDVKNPHNNGSYLRGLIHDASKEIKRLEEIERLSRVTLSPFSGQYSCSSCFVNSCDDGRPSFLVGPEDCDCGCHETARNIVALKEALACSECGDDAPNPDCDRCWVT